MLLILLSSLIPLLHGDRCYNGSAAKQGAEKLTDVMETIKTVGESLKLTFFNYNSDTDEIKIINGLSKIEFRITMVRHREEMPDGGFPFKFHIQDGDLNRFQCYKTIEASEDFQSLKSEAIGRTEDSVDYFLQVLKSSCDESRVSETTSMTDQITTSPSYTTSSQWKVDISVLLSVRIIEPLDVRLFPISENTLRISVDNLKSKDKTSPEVQCFVNGVEIIKSPHFKVPSKLKEPSGKKVQSVYVKEEKQVRTMTVTMKCWSEVHSGPLICSARMSGYTYWSSPLYLNKRGDLEDCQQLSRLSLVERDESSGITRLTWDCTEEHDSYRVHINRTSGDNSESCPFIIETGDSCSVETDLLKKGDRYNVWVTSSSDDLVVDITHVLISDKAHNGQTQILQKVLAGLGALVVVLVMGTLAWKCRARRSTRWSGSEVQNLNKEDLDRYETGDIVILHITNSEDV